MRADRAARARSAESTKCALIMWPSAANPDGRLRRHFWHRHAAAFTDERVLHSTKGLTDFSTRSLRRRRQEWGDFFQTEKTPEPTSRKKQPWQTISSWARAKRRRERWTWCWAGMGGNPGT